MDSWSNLCRCCLSPESIVSLLNEDGNIQEQFSETTSLKVKAGDGLPENLCNNCYSLMLSAYQFRTQCIKIDKELRLQLQTVDQNISFPENTVTMETQERAESVTIEDFSNVSMKDLEGIIKEEPNDNDDDFYYVVVVDDEEENEKEALEDKDSKGINMSIEDIKSDIRIDENPVSENEVQDCIQFIEEQNDTTSSQFENCIDSFLITNPNAHVPATILANEEEHEIDDRFDNNSIDVEASQDQTLAIIDNPQDKSEEQFSVAVTEDIIKNLSNKNFIKILTPSGAERTILFKSNESIKYLTEPDTIKTISVGEDSVPEEVIVYEGGEESELQILKCDASELIIEYANGENISTVIQQEDGTFLCECGDQFKDLDTYQAHHLKHNPSEDHLCNLCGKGFETSEILTGHMLLHNTTGLLVTCPFCNQNVKRNTLTQHIKYTHNSKPQCNLCLKTFANQNNLKRHMMIHSGVKEFECDICKKRFHQKITMQTHKLTHINPFTCSQCGMKCENKTVLAAHKGTDECTNTRKMKVKEELMKTVKQEIMTNAGKLLGFACALCKKMFSVESALEQHVENKHIVDGDDPNSDAKLKRTIKRFECIICGKGCSSQAMLVMHERVHTNERPYPCQLCSLRFKTKTHLRTHQLTHTREKKFGCSVCMKFFALKGNLVVHLRTHTGERPYVCSICGDAYIDSKYLKKHKQKKHSIDNVPWNKYE